MNNNPCIEIKNLSYRYDEDKSIIDNLNFQLEEGEIVSIIGPNGCGKTTLINLIAGFIDPTIGEIIRHNNSSSKLFSSVVFQDSPLLEWKSAFRNVELSLISNIKDPLERKIITEKYLKLLRINDHQNKLSKELSGGLKQRTAIARALAPNPRLLLLDEPFSSLDLPAKESLKRDLLDIIKRDNKSVMMVTHDIDEAIMFSDKILLLLNGKCEVIDLKKYSGKSSKLREEILKKLNLNGGDKSEK